MRRHADVGIAPDLAQQLDGLGPRELLADEAGHEPPAANLSLGSHPSERDQQIPPCRRDRLAREQIRRLACYWAMALLLKEIPA